MFINVLRKSPQKQFTGETYRFTIILDTSASSTSKSSTLTTLAESHPVPMNRSTAPSSGPPTGCVFSQVGAVMSRTAHPERVHVHVCGAFISGANPSSFTFQNETVGERKNKNQKKNISHKTPLWPSKTQLSGVCHTAQMHLVQQSHKQKHKITEKKKPR